MAGPISRARWPGAVQDVRQAGRCGALPDWHRAFETRRELHDPDDGRVTFAVYAKEWLATRVHRPATQARVESDLRVHVLPYLGDRPLASVRHSDVQGWVRSRAEILAPGTVENVYRTVAAIFRSAVRDRVIALTPCEGIVLPRRISTETVPPTVDEVRALLTAMPARYRIAGVLAAGA